MIRNIFNIGKQLFTILLWVSFWNLANMFVNKSDIALNLILFTVSLLATNLLKITILDR